MSPAQAPAQAVIASLRSGEPASAELVDSYYSLCIPFYREFLGEHWHTGFHEAQGDVGPQDQLRMELLVARSAGVAAGSEVLDVGCGIGGPACHIARATGARVQGLTPNAQQLELARGAARRHGVEDRVRFTLGDAGRLPFPDASFDALLFFESACHFPDRQRFFGEAWRVLRPGGRIAGEDWLASGHGGAQAQASWSERICAAWAIPALGTLEGYGRGMRQAGFEVELARDMRDEMALLRGFIATRAGRAEVRRELRATADTVRRYIMEGLTVLGEAAECGAFTVGRFVARKPPQA